jgi:hypothetical protein
MVAPKLRIARRRVLELPARRIPRCLPPPCPHVIAAMPGMFFNPQGMDDPAADLIVSDETDERR